jgi:hypothetical protein
VVNVKDYMAPTITALSEQDMHDTTKFTMSTLEFNKRMEEEK